MCGWRDVGKADHWWIGCYLRHEFWCEEIPERDDLRRELALVEVDAEAVVEGLMDGDGGFAVGDAVGSGEKLEDNAVDLARLFLETTRSCLKQRTRSSATALR